MQKDKLFIYGHQGEIVWEDPEANLNRNLRIIDDLRIKPDIFILPETFSSGFSNHVEAISEHMDGPTVSAFIDVASKYDMAIGGSMVINENGKYYNRFLFIHPNGKVDYYDKRHLFSMSGEDNAYTRGEERKVVEFRGWRILLQVCYDLRFPVWSRNQNDYDLIIYTANWPKQRQHVWDTLLKARAIENQCYVFGLNRTGADGNQIGYTGGSVFIDPKGMLMNSPHGHEAVVAIQMSLSDLQEFREKFPVLKDRDKFGIKF
ncbi:amidohydrolase [Saccharicrinis sp. FJH62]|uniref:amidohydrolase n=1 Tax=Saccharicrinis sp. FJH62 TaxID=3344657 RepID=UPI0035D4E6C7